MNPEYKTKWLAALRSGEYRQGAGQLRTRDDEYCCMGVLCAIVPSVEWKPEGNRFRAEFGGSDASLYVPAAVIDEADFDPRQERRLAEMNDNGVTFPEIADYIEANL